MSMSCSMSSNNNNNNINSKLINMIGIDKVNKSICNQLAHCSFSQFSDALKDKNTYDEEGFWKMETQYKIIKQYCQEQIKNNYVLNRNYANAVGETEGRAFVQENMGLQRINKYMRGALCDGIYNDFDIKAAHHCILKYICNLNNISCNYLNIYISDRENKLNDIEGLTRDESKQLYISSLNNKEIITKYQGKKIKDSFCLEFDKEIKTIQYQLVNKFPALKKHLIKRGKSDNLEGKLVNHLLCKYENEILLEVCNKLNVGKVYSFDGFMEFITHDLSSDDMITQLNSITENKYGIVWANKPHDISLKHIILGWNINQEVISHITIDLHQMSNFLLKGVLKNKIKLVNNDIYYNDNNKWVFTTMGKLENIKSRLRRFIGQQDLYLTKGDKNIPISSSLTLIKDLTTFIIDNSPIDNNFNSTMYESTLGKICFTNGYYDFTTNKFNTDYDNVYTPIIVNKTFEKKRNKPILKEIFERVLYPIFSIKNVNEDKDRVELMRHYLHCLARASAGRVEDKRWFLMEGLRNSGKGVLTDLLKNCLGSYIQTTSSNNFIAKKSTGDSAKELSWILDYEFSRFAITQEMSIIDDGTKLDGAMVKKFVSGGDYMSARKNFQDEREFRVQSTLMICCNDLPNIVNTDCLDYCLNFQMKSKFIDSNEKEEFSNYSYFKKDNTVKTDFIKRDEVCNEFINLLIEAYKWTDTFIPESIQEEDQDDELDDLATLTNAFEITNNGDDILSNSQIKHQLTNIKSVFKVNKAVKLLVGKGAFKYRDSTGRGLKKIKIINNN